MLLGAFTPKAATQPRNYGKMNFVARVHERHREREEDMTDIQRLERSQESFDLN